MAKSEDSEQITFIQRVRFLWPQYSDNVYAVPNGGYRNPRLAALLKATGTLAGAPDVVVDLARHGWHGLRIELKRRKGGSLSTDQVRVHKALAQEGYLVVVARGAEEAWELFEWYVNGPRTMGGKSEDE